MKLSKSILLIFLLGLCTPLAFAQGKIIKYIPKAGKGTKIIPAPINPKLPPAVRANFAMPVVRPQGTNISPKLPSTIQKTATTHAMAQMPMPSAPLLNALQKDFLTGPQALIAYMPDWRRERGGLVFNDAQLDVIEQTFKETDKALFQLDENGHWLAPVEGSAEWEYERWYAKKLNESLVKFGDAELKTLFGKFALFDDVFTRLNLQAFLLIHKRAPKTDAPGEEGKLARHVRYNLDKRDGREMNPEVTKYIYGDKETTAPSTPRNISKPTATENVGTPQVIPETVTPATLPGFNPVTYYYPAWRQELGGMFSKEQLDAIEQAFATTDDWIFLRGEDGELTVRNPDEWDYQARFLTILTRDSGVSFTDKQIKQLVGGGGIKGFTFSRYFTLKKAQTFCYAYGRTPRHGIKDKGGNSLKLSDLRRLAKEGDAEAAILVEELELGQQVHNALQNWPKDLLEYIKLNTLYQQFRNQKAPETPAQVLAKLEQFIEQYGRAPRQSIQGKGGKLLTLSKLRRLAEEGDTAAAALAKELELGKQVSKALQRWPKDWPEYKKLNTLYQQFRNTDTPAQVLAKFKQFIEQHGRVPRQGISEDGKLLTLSELRKRAEGGDPEATILAKELELGQQINNALRGWPKDWPEYYKELKAIYVRFRK